MASSLTASSRIALRAAVSTFLGGQWNASAPEVLRHIKASFPIMGRVVERSDISRELRALGFQRDHATGKDAWKHRDRDHPRWGEAASTTRALERRGAL